MTKYIQTALFYEDKSFIYSNWLTGLWDGTANYTFFRNLAVYDPESDTEE